MTQASKFLVRMKRVAGSGRFLTFGLLLAALVAASLLLAAKPAHAKTFTVNTTSDDSGGKACDLGECTCDASECILRAAIEQANRTAGTDTINFNIPGDGPHTISPSASL